MGLIKHDEKKMIADWAIEIHKSDESSWCDIVLPPFQNNNDSYWQEYDNAEDIIDYGFETIPELRKIINELPISAKMDEEMKTSVAVAAFKEKAKHRMSEKTSSETNIPGFIYAF